MCESRGFAVGHGGAARSEIGPTKRGNPPRDLGSYKIVDGILS